tara:strand:+ start:417 stop:662 length:246 start_codon:yes stop_codon:yes gene_type:complete
MNIPIPEMTVVLQEEIKSTDDKLINVDVRDNLIDTVTASWQFGDKTFNQVLWNNTTTPTYDEIGVWTYNDAVNRMIELTKK